MIGEPRTISRIVELLHLPSQSGPELLRDVYAEISDSCGYDNFIRQPGGARLESAASEAGSISRLTFGQDRITFQEERSTSSLEHFLRRVEAATSVAISKLGIPLLVARNITQRAIASVPGGELAASFLGRTVFRFEPEDLESLERPAQVVGFRLNFPARTPQEGAHRARIETYLRDPGALYLEDVGTFKVPIQSTAHAQVATELREVEQFLGERLTTFLNGLDA